MIQRCYGCMMTYDDNNGGICPHCGYAKDTAPESARHLRPGVILNSRFIVGKVVGYGGFGVTYVGWDKVLAQKVAIKEYLPSEFSTRVPGNTFVTVYDGEKKEQFSQGKFKFIEEAKKIAKFNDCQGIVKVFDSFVENDTAYIVMEYIEGVTLEEYLREHKTIPTDEAVLMMLPIVESLSRVHKAGIIHRDIAPNNIMIDKNGDVKVIDFGAARFATATHTKSMTVIIKPGYSPEEQYMSRSDQGPHTDVYAVAATLYKMITGELPPDAMERRAQFQSKGKDILKPISKYDKNISKNIENAIMNAMNPEIEKRTPDMETFMYELTTDEPVVRRNGKIKLTDVYRWPKWLKITITAAAMFVLAVSVLLGMGIIGFEKNLKEEMQIPDGMVQVPWVVNKTEEAASVIMNERQLIMTIKPGEYSDEVEKGMVMAQDIAGGYNALINSPVCVTLSRGREMKTIPASATLYANAQEVRTTLEELGFYVTINEESDYSNIPEGLITALETEDGEKIEVNNDLPKGSVIIITASKGIDPNAVIEEKMIKVPNFINLTKKQAYEIIGSEIRIEIIDRYNEQYEAGKIWYQSIEADTEIENTVTITLYASVSNKVKVPEVINASYEVAVKELKDAGLECGEPIYIEHETILKGTVLEQSHNAGDMVEAGTAIVLTVSAGPSKKDVPDVEGMTEAEARQKLTDSGFVPNVEYCEDHAKKGTVIRQDIKGAAYPGATITITVSSGYDPCAKGHNYAAATCTKAATCLRCGATTGSKLGHDTVVDDAVAATCTTAGKTEGSHCSVCNEVIVAQTIIAAKGHTTVVDKAVTATCTTAGKTEGSHCSVCNAVIKAQTTIAAKGHTTVVDKAVAATCTATGKTEGSHCSVCNTVFVAQTSIPATGVHVYDDRYDANCNVCGKSRTMYTYFHYTDGTNIGLSPCQVARGNNWKSGGWEETLTVAEPLKMVSASYDSFYHTYVSDPGYRYSCTNWNCPASWYGGKYYDSVTGEYWYQIAY